MNESVAAAVDKKVILFDQDQPRFLTRGVLAGAYLALGTAFAGAAGHAVEQLAPGLGAMVFAALFGLGLFAIVVLGAELATGSMMFFSYAAATKQVRWGKAVWIVFLTTVYNLIGVILIGAALGVSAKFADMDPSHLLSTISSGKVEKSVQGMLVEAMVANFVVNMAIIGGILSKEVVSKFFAIVPIIAIFVGLSTEHVVANFCVRYPVAVSNLQRVLKRRGQLELTGNLSRPGRAGGRPAKQFRFVRRELVVTDPFAVFAPAAAGLAEN